MGLFSVVECVPVDMAKELFEVNFFGTLRLIQAVRGKAGTLSTTAAIMELLECLSYSCTVLQSLQWRD